MSGIDNAIMRSWWVMSDQSSAYSCAVNVTGPPRENGVEQGVAVGVPARRTASG